MYRRDTIAAIATPVGTGGISIVRVSGPDAEDVGARVFRRFPRSGAESHRLYAGRIVAVSGETLDRGLGVLMRAPRSYTGENVLELHCHGGIVVARSALGATLAAGARGAERGEFTLRAFLNGRLDLAQAEAVADLIAARTPAAARAAAVHLEGGLSQKIEALRQDIVGLAARLEVAIDFSEEDVGPMDAASLARDADGIAERLLALGATFDQGRRLREGVRVAIAGKPNVGKSSLLNALVASDRAIVTAAPGTTRDVLEETIDLGGIALVLVDTAGLRAAADEAERIGVERARREISEADLVIVVVDGSRGLDGGDEEVFDATHKNRRIILINKMDRGLVLDGVRVGRLAPGCLAIEASAARGDGIERLREALVDLALGGRPLSAEPVIMRERHREALNAAASALGNARRGLKERHPPDIVAVEVMAALERVGEVVGRGSPDEVLERIFAEFCIGK
jgi:tRNA modification GTPase